MIEINSKFESLNKFTDTKIYSSFCYFQSVMDRDICIFSLNIFNYSGLGKKSFATYINPFPLCGINQNSVETSRLKEVEIETHPLCFF